MENTNEVAGGAESPPCKCKPVFNADFAFIAITAAAVYSYILLYAIIFMA